MAGDVSSESSVEGLLLEDEIGDRKGQMEVGTCWDLLAHG